MNVLLTVHQFLPEYYSGTEILTFSVAKELIRRGHRVSVFTGYPARSHLSDHERFDEYEIDGIDVFRFHHNYVPMGGQFVLSELEYNNKLAARFFAQLLQRTRPNIVHFFHFSRLGAALIDAASTAEVPAYYTPTDFWSICPTNQLLLKDGNICRGPTRYGGNCIKHIASLTRGENVARKARFIPNFVVDTIAKLTIDGVLPDYQNNKDVAAVGQRTRFNVARLNALHGIISPTRLMTRVLVRNGIDERLITQSAYGIDLSGYNARTKKSRADDPITFGFIGTLAKHKGCHVLIDAFKGIDPNRARLRVYGNPADFPGYFEALQQSAEGFGSIEFCGTFPNGQIGEVMADLDVLVVPSVWYENTPLVIYSALAAKCPVVASDFPGMSEVVRDGWNGLTFPPGNVQGLRSKLMKLIDDPALLKLLRTNCTPPKSISEYVDGLLALYDKRHAILAGRGEIPGRQNIMPLEKETSFQPV